MPELDAYDIAALERIKRRIQIHPRTNCWEWQGARTPTGYGMVGYGHRDGNRRRWDYAHRLMYRLTVGPIPAGQQLDHFRCDNPPCCNPTHLRPVSPRENSLRSSSPSAVNAGKTHCSRGHRFSETSTYVTRAGKRQCRICTRIRNRAYDAAKRARDIGAQKPNTPSHCVAGHEYTEQNTYVSRGGYFRCRECARIREQARRARQRTNLSQGSAGDSSASPSPSTEPQEVRP